MFLMLDNYSLMLVIQSYNNITSVSYCNYCCIMMITLYIVLSLTEICWLKICRKLVIGEFMHKSHVYLYSHILSEKEGHHF